MSIHSFTVDLADQSTDSTRAAVKAWVQGFDDGHTRTEPAHPEITKRVVYSVFAILEGLASIADTPLVDERNRQAIAAAVRMRDAFYPS